VREFTGTAPQSDDLAILTLKVHTVDRLKLALGATSKEVMRGVEALQEFATAQHVPGKATFSLALALEECASNIVKHGLKDAEKTLQVAFERTGDSFVIELCDDGPEFDPTAATSLKSQAEDDDLPGGWGLELVRRNVDSIHYRREAGRNILRLIKRLVSASSDE